jgi:hypothetical protein
MAILFSFFNIEELELLAGGWFPLADTLYHPFCTGFQVP